MTDYQPLRVAVVGCGGIAAGYGSALSRRPEKVEIAGAYDIAEVRAQKWVEEFGGTAYETLDALLADEAIELVVNLTIHQAHAEVNMAALRAGKHVHTEKPLAGDLADGIATVRLAEDRGLRISAAPFTFLGEPQQTFMKAVRDGRIGKPLVAYSAMNSGRVEEWHPNASAFFSKGAGPLLDVGVYALGLLTSTFGVVRRVTAFGGVQLPERVQKRGARAGQAFDVETPDTVVAGLEFESGLMARCTSSFLVGGSKDGSGTEVHGEAGALYIGSNQMMSSPVEIYEDGKWSALEPVAEPTPGMDWGRAIVDLADSIRTGTPQRTSGRHALHLLDICLSALESIEHGHAVSTTTRFHMPPPLYE